MTEDDDEIPEAGRAKPFECSDRFATQMEAYWLTHKKPGPRPKPKPAVPSKYRKPIRENDGPPRKIVPY